MEQGIHSLAYMENMWKPYFDFAESNREDKGMPPLSAEHKLKMGNVMESDLLDIDNVKHIPFDMTIAMCDIDFKQDLITQAQCMLAIQSVEKLRVEKVGKK